MEAMMYPPTQIRNPGTPPMPLKLLVDEHSNEELPKKSLSVKENCYIQCHLVLHALLVIYGRNIEAILNVRI